MRAALPCRRPGCPATVARSGFCDNCKRTNNKAQDQRRGTAAERGYGSRWQKARATYLQSHPLCVLCMDSQRATAATVVDHIIPHRGDQALFWDVEGNWQALCATHHNQKTMRESVRR